MTKDQRQKIKKNIKISINHAIIAIAEVPVDLNHNNVNVLEIGKRVTKIKEDKETDIEESNIIGLIITTTVTTIRVEQINKYSQFFLQI